MEAEALKARDFTQHFTDHLQQKHDQLVGIQASKLMMFKKSRRGGSESTCWLCCFMEATLFHVPKGVGQKETVKLHV